MSVLPRAFIDHSVSISIPSLSLSIESRAAIVLLLLCWRCCSGLYPLRGCQISERPSSELCSRNYASVLLGTSRSSVLLEF